MRYARILHFPSRPASSNSSPHFPIPFHVSQWLCNMTPITRYTYILLSCASIANDGAVPDHDGGAYGGVGTCIRPELVAGCEP